MRITRSIFLGAMVSCLLTIASQANAGERLFQDWEFGTPMSEFASSDGYYDCTEEMGLPARCLEEVTFLDQSFELALLSNEGQLEQVFMIAPFSQPNLIKLMGALKRGFTMVSLDGETESLDLLETARVAEDFNDFQLRLANFEQKLTSLGFISYLFVEQDANTVRKRRNSVDVIRKAPANTRAAEVIVTDDVDGSWLAIRFSIPRLSARNIRNQADSAPKEDF